MFTHGSLAKVFWVFFFFSDFFFFLVCGNSAEVRGNLTNALYCSKEGYWGRSKRGRGK